MEGGCVFVQSYWPGLVAAVGDHYERGLTLLAIGPEPVGFQASFNASPFESLGILHDHANDVIAGGYKFGGTGRRGEGEQWSIGSREARIEYSLVTYSGEPLHPPFAIQGGLVLVPVVVRAEWTGESIENWTGAESVGRVEVTCAYAVGLAPRG
jgi:hypothetical protein